MESIEQVATCILDVSKKIYQINEENNPQAIFKGKIFLLNGEDVSVEQSDCRDCSYYFETPEMDGMIIKKENDDYCIKATIQYVNVRGEKCWFAKIRILDCYDEICIRGRRTGSWEMADFEDDDFNNNPDFELPLVLRAMYNSLYNMYKEVNENAILGKEKYIPNIRKKLIKYNV